jgi:hypothetical protein
MKKITTAVLAIVLGAFTTLAHAAPTPTNLPTTPAPRITPMAVSPGYHAACPSCGCQPTHARGGCLHRLIEWCTYCPQERIGCCSSCNSCHYKGFIHPYLLMMNPPCKEGSGMHATLPPENCHGGHGCAKCSTCGCK